jgi:replicative DNA helicase
MIRDNGVIADIAGILAAEDFRNEFHARVFRTAMSLWSCAEPVDTITLATKLRAQNNLDLTDYLPLDQLCDAAPTAANAEYYARIVSEKSRLRALAWAGEEITHQAVNQSGSAAGLIEDAQTRLADLADAAAGAGVHTLGDAIDQACDRIDARAEGRNLGVLTGWHKLDRLTGGLQPAELVIVAARTSIGKTSLALGLARNIALQSGLAYYFASLEQREVDLAERLLASESSIDSYKIRTGKLGVGDTEALAAGANRLKKNGKGFFTDGPRQTLWSIAATARQLHRKHNIKIVIVDYLQRVDDADRRARYRHEQVASMSRALKSLALELSVPVVALCQLNRQADGERPRLAHLAESGAIEQDADTAILLHRDEASPETVTAFVAKQRNGPTGEVELHFDRRFMRFEDLEADESLWRRE